MANILVVEDDKNQSLLYKKELSEAGYEVFVARDGREAVTMAKLNPPDLVVMDINIPGMDGIEAMGKILGENNRIPVVINTAYSSFKDNFMTWAAEAYIVKSADLSELKNTIKKVLEKKEGKVE
jgi:DNA-binding response OmpR family regulator